MRALLAQVDAAVLASPLAEGVTYTSGAGAAVTPRGIFDAVYTKVDAGEVGVSSAGPAVFLRLSELSSDPQTDLDATVTVYTRDATGAVISSQVHSIREVQPDGQGGVVLLLHEV